VDDVKGMPLEQVLRRRRIAMGLNQERLAKKVGVTGAAVSGWENGARVPRAASVPDLSAALQIDVETLANLVMSASR